MSAAALRVVQANDPIPEPDPLTAQIGRMHALGFSTPFLHDCLHVVDGGARMQPVVMKHLQAEGLIANAVGSLTEKGRAVLERLQQTNKAQISLWAQNMVAKNSARSAPQAPTPAP